MNPKGQRSHFSVMFCSTCLVFLLHTFPSSSMFFLSYLHLSHLAGTLEQGRCISLCFLLKHLAEIRSQWTQQCSSTRIFLQPSLHWVVPGTVFPLHSQIISQWYWGINTAIQKGISLLMAVLFHTLILRQFSASGISRQCNLKHFKITFPHRSWENPGSD